MPKFNPGDYSLSLISDRNRSKVRTYFESLSANFKLDTSDAAERLNILYDLLLKPTEIRHQVVLGNHIKELVGAVADPSTKRKMMQKVAFLVSRLGYSELSVQTPPNSFNLELWASAVAQVKATGSIDLPVAPTRIIAFHNKDYDNLEVMESVKIAYEKHAAEPCLVTCSEREIIDYGTSCTTLVLIGHGRYCRVGDRDEGTHQPLTLAQAQRARAAETIYLGPFKGVVADIATNITTLLIDANLNSVTHCRLLMCMSGAIPKEFSHPAVYYKRKSGDDVGSASATVICENPKDKVFESDSVAGMIWEKLFVAYPARFNMDTDFALSAAPGIINPIPDKRRFEGTSRADRWDKGKHVKTAASFWKPEEPEICRTKSITQATPASTKALRQTGGGVTEDGRHRAPTYKK